MFGVVLYGVIGFNDCDLFCCNGLIELLFIIMPPIVFWNDAVLLWVVVISMLHLCFMSEVLDCSCGFQLEWVVVVS